MKGRCLNVTDRAFKWYGAKGVTVCEKWLLFEGFLADMGECPPGYSIERVDFKGNYEPSNCKWIPRNEQGYNTSAVKHIEIEGVVLTLREAAIALGVSKDTIKLRLRRYGSIYGLKPETRRATEAAIAKWKALAVTPLP